MSIINEDDILTKGIHIKFFQLEGLEIAFLARKIKDFIESELKDNKFEIKFTNW